LRRRRRHRPVQYLNNILEQDHRAIKRRVNARRDFGNSRRQGNHSGLRSYTHDPERAGALAERRRCSASDSVHPEALLNCPPENVTWESSLASSPARHQSCNTSVGFGRRVCPVDTPQVRHARQPAVLPVRFPATDSCRTMAPSLANAKMCSHLMTYFPSFRWSAATFSFPVLESRYFGRYFSGANLGIPLVRSVHFSYRCWASF
jgi:hypothetical protein